MSLRWFVTVCLFFTAQSAVVKSRNIPVEVVYDGGDPLYYGNRNLDAKIQLSADELLKLKLSDDIINEGQEDVVEAEVAEVIPEVQGNPYGVRNLDAKVQLSPEELGQAVKFLPNTVENEDVDQEIKSNLNENTEQPVKSQQNTEQQANPQQNNKEVAKPVENNAFAMLQQAENIAYFGINSIRNNIEKASENLANAKPSAETWEKLNQTLEKFFKDQYRSVNLKDDAAGTNENTNVNNNENNVSNQNQFFENFVQNFQTTVTNFFNNFQQNNNQKPPGSEDEQQNQQNVFQNFFNGIGAIVTSMNNLNGQNGQNTTSGQEDTGVAQGGGSNFFIDVFNSIQNFVAGQSNQGNNPSQSANANQSDTGVQPPSNQGPGGFFQGAINQFQGIISNFQQTTSTKAPVQGDEGTGPSSTTQSSIFGGINQIFQGGSGGSNPFVSGVQNVGNQFGQALGGQNGSNPFVSGLQNATSQFGQLGGQNGSNPFVTGLQNAGNQIGQLGGQNSSNPFVSGLQNAGNQIGQLGGQGSGGQGGSNPLVENIQNFGNQIGQFGGGGSTAAAASTEKSKISNENDEQVNPLPTIASTENLKEEMKTEK
ncbi:putative uncharacterized protein DDB_G0286901 [Zophobas morio]|uniref:putative uncharacterized protein DDB_G0286901 n=1 Tax=Zophobas morio TaxID=2755281 RepID=UPI0030839BE6